MKMLIEQTLTRLFPKLWAYYSLIRDRNSYLYSTGWIQSIEKGKPVDEHGNLIPWMNFPTINILKDRLKDDLNLFEFGSGYSTYFYAKRVMTVTSIEYNDEWFQMIKSDMPENVNLIYQENDIDGAYCRIIATMNEQYDVVIVDGRDRVNCLKQCISALSPRGIILLDDSQRERYKEGIEFVKALGFRALDIDGLKPTGADMHRSTLLYRNDNCLGI